MSGSLRYSVGLSFDGVTYRVDQVPEDVARDWLWEHVRGGTVQSSIVQVLQVTPFVYDPALGYDRVTVRVGGQRFGERVARGESTLGGHDAGTRVES